MRAALFATTALALVGCATPGPPHAYLYSPAAGENTVRDVDARTGAELAQVPAFTEPGEQVIGLAYEPFTDHLFLRIFPGNFIRVVDRPAGAVKRVFRAPSLPVGGRDFAIRSRDRHLFFSDSTGPSLIETTLYGDFVRSITLPGLIAPVWGVAHDAHSNELLILPEEIGATLLRFSPQGAPLGTVTLETPVQGASLAYDSDTGQTFASLADGSALGVFDADGRLLRRLPRPAAELEVFIEVGPRSLLRLF